MAEIIQLRRDTAANWTSANPTLAQGELGVELDTGKFKVGDGTTAWNSQDYIIDTGGYARLAVAQTFSKPQKAATLALTHNTAWDAGDKQNLTVDVNGSAFTIANPTNLIADAYYTVYVSYTTAHSIAFGSNFKGVSVVTPTATAGAKDHFIFRAGSAGNNLYLVGAMYDVGAS